ncbi:surface lipoprotein assembly modifier, partial [Ursidibacter sp. B-7004-1]
YIRDENVNNSSRSPNIENTGFSKSDEMLPKKAHGIGYNFGLNKDFNVVNSHYLYLSTQIDGKLHWDNRNYDDIYTRNYFGYKYKKKSYTLSLLPLYEKRWYSNKRYQWGNGIRAEYQKWISQNWQVSSAIEYTKQRYFRNSNQNSYNQLFSSTILWKRNLKQFFYFGIDINKEKSNEKQYSYNSQGVRLGWGQEWKYNISSRINLGISHRKFKDKAILGGILPLGKVRQDKIFYVNLSLWNNNWHLWGILPKLNLAWKQQKSNIPTMYSYSERDIRLNFEKDF